MLLSILERPHFYKFEPLLQLASPFQSDITRYDKIQGQYTCKCMYHMIFILDIT